MISLERQEILRLLNTKAGSQEQELLFSKASDIRRALCGNKVYIRAVIEISNYCRCNCKFCGNSITNNKITRYRLSYEELILQINIAIELGIDVIHFASGEDPNYDHKILLHAIEYAASRGLIVELACGKLSYSYYQSLYNAGAKRYILKFETSNKNLFDETKKCQATLDNIKEHIFYLKELRFNVGTGNIIGLPNQTENDLFNDIKLINDLNPDMISTSVFTPNLESDYKFEKPGNTGMALNYLAIVRLLFPEKNCSIPTNSTFGSYGKSKALEIAANEISLNLTPIQHSKKYSLYSGKDRKKATIHDIVNLINKVNMEISSIRKVINYE